MSCQVSYLSGHAPTQQSSSTVYFQTSSHSKLTMSLNGYVTQEDGTRFDKWFRQHRDNTYLRVDKSPQNPDTHLLFEARDAETETVVSSHEIKLNIPPEEWFKIPFSCPRTS